MQDLVRSIRAHLGMEVAFLSRFHEGSRVFIHVDADSAAFPGTVGAGDPLEDSYCQRVVDGRLPEVMPDAFAVPAAVALPVTKALPVRAHISVPVRLSDGSVYGTLCAFSSKPDASLGRRDVDVMHAMAEIAARSIERDTVEPARRAETANRIRSVMTSQSLQSLYQPIVDLRTGKVVGFESLTRFHAEPKQSPDRWFADAASVGLGVELEIFAGQRSLRALSILPAPIYVGVNLSPNSLLDRRLYALIAQWPAHRIVFEVTEHDVVEEYDKLAAAIEPLRRSGAKLAVDDAGAGYASFRHILNLRPDYIKLDISLTREIEKDASRRALAAAITSFASSTGSIVVAEGIETEKELQVFRQLGVGKAQGYFFGKPAGLEVAERIVGE